MDYTKLTDDELGQARLDVAIEQERRQRLAQAPAQIAAIAARYIEDGGDRADLDVALEPTEP